MKERFLKTGLSGLADYEVVELLLTLAILEKQSHPNREVRPKEQP